MKRLFCYLLSFLLCCSLLGCQKEEKPPLLQEPVTFFYLQNNYSYTNTDTVIGSEQRDAVGHKEDLAYLINLFLLGPQDGNLAQTFPADCALVSFTIKDDIITLTVTDQLSALTGIELTTACVCLAKTVTELTGFRTVIIRTQTQLLGGKNRIAIWDGATVLLDDYTALTQTK